MSRIDLYPNKKSPPSAAGPATGTNVAGDKMAQDVFVYGGTVTGDLTPSGLRTAIRTTTMDVTDVATPLPAIALTSRNAMTVHNKSGVDTLYIGNSNVTADTVIGTTSGLEVNPNDAFNTDITANIILYGIAPAGKTIRVKVTELS